jgi:purine-binding chemotaxis protein CheW
MEPNRLPPPDQLELISFEIAGQEYCIDVRSVREIRGWTPPTFVPSTPPYVLGVINLRGVVMPVLDVRARLGLGQTTPSSRHVYVVVQRDDEVMGLLVDAVQETFSADPQMLQPPPPIVSSLEEALVDAILPLEGRMLARLVVGALLAGTPPAMGTELPMEVLAA